MVQELTVGVLTKGLKMSKVSKAIIIGILLVIAFGAWVPVIFADMFCSGSGCGAAIFWYAMHTAPTLSISSFVFALLTMLVPTD